MNYKTITLLTFVIIAATIVVGVGQRLGKNVERSGSPANVEARMDATADTFLPLTDNENASETDEDVLTTAKKSSIAPPLASGKWINSDPLTIEKLRGNVVLVDFWTFGCYNCINTLPTLKNLDAKYRDKGLTIVGVETPETSAERVFDNLVKAVDKRGIKYPVITDYKGETWRAYDVEAWPTVIILDKQGRIRYRHVGEGQYEMQERVIKTLLAEDDTKTAAVAEN